MPSNIKAWEFSIGGIQLTKFEVPEEFDYGHDIKHAEHDYISETGTPIKVIQQQGAFATPTTWKGILFGSTALSRFAQLDALGVAGQPVTFVWGPLSFQVFIASIKATAKYNNEVHYEISLKVIKDLNGTVPPLPNGVSFDTGTQNFYSSAQSAYQSLQSADSSLPATVSNAVNLALAALAAAVPFKSASLTTIQNVIDLIGDATTALQVYTTPLLGSAASTAEYTKLNAGLATLQNFELLNTNLQQLTGQNNVPSQAILTNKSLFEIATQYYPNSDPALAAQLIAQANKLHDLFLPAPKTIILPPVFS